MQWDPEQIADAPKGEVRARARRADDGECVLCGGPLSNGDWQVKLTRRGSAKRESAHTHCAGDHGWTVA